MKKKFLLTAALLMLILLCGCSEKKGSVALITDVGTVEDGSYNQGAWEGIKEYCDEQEVPIPYAYYQPKEAMRDSYLEAIDQAVSDGATLIVCPGYLPEEAVYVAQKEYSKIRFILLDGVVHNADLTDYTIKKNVMQIVFAEEQAGFLAGYAAVRDGYTHLGFIGGEAEDSVIRFGYGFVQGADYAAIEMGRQVEIRYTYAGTYFESADVLSYASDAYSMGTEVIFACGGAMGRSVMDAAEACGGKVIGVDVDQSEESPTVITSALKNLSHSVYNGVSDYMNDRFKGGVTTTMNASNNGIGLAMENSQFRNFTKEDYDAIYTRLINASIEPYAQTNDGTTDDLLLVNTTVLYEVFPGQ
ncbi:MAG: BMP family ABC transporter substrate-binding protein [Lachnospiraceae bacterium]|nr:BMP family ABC transporter substrate-binding protein [Lachnospiraceae bacterium]